MLRPIPFHSLRMVPTLQLSSEPWPALRDALDAPILTTEYVMDSIGIPYAYDIVLQHGFYLLVIVAVIIRSFSRKGESERDE